MVSFQCEGCGDVLTKKKLDPHYGRCRGASFTCIDCMTNFQGTSYRAHMSCMTEAQKYQGALYRQPGRQHKQTNHEHNDSQTSPVEAAETSGQQQLARIDVPPPAPSPPPRHSNAGVKQIDSTPNIFNYLVEGSDEDGSISPVHHRRHQKEDGSRSKDGTVEPHGRKQSSSRHGHVNFDHDFGPSLQSLAAATPASTMKKDSRSRDVVPEPSSTVRSKRKRTVDNAETMATEAEQTISLHSGLTGGLSKMLVGAFGQEDASPLSPKKRAKRTRDDRMVQRAQEVQQTSPPPKYSQTSSLIGKRPKQLKDHRASSKNGRDHKAFASGPSRQLPHQSFSEYFLSLVDKQSSSSNGHSFSSLLNKFHDGAFTDSGPGAGDYTAMHDRIQEQVLRGLRVKKGPNGGFLLFPRPHKELKP